MINVGKSRSARERVRAQLLRVELQLSFSLRKAVESLILKQFNEAASLVDHGHRTVSGVVEDPPLRSMLSAKFNQTAGVFSDLFFKEAEASKSARRQSTKATADQANRFWRNAHVHIAKQTAEQVVKINGVTRKVIKRVVEHGTLAGDSNAIIAARLVESGRIQSAFRAVRIAQTEVHSLSQYSLNESAIASEIVVRKTWIASIGARTRDIHAHADGETVNVEDTFEKTGESLDYPGDMAGSAENVINCRCVAVYDEG